VLRQGFPRQYGIVDGACQHPRDHNAGGDGAPPAGGPAKRPPLYPMTALPAVWLGCTSLGMTATSAHDKDPLLERQKSPNRNAGISARRRRFVSKP
jgi:hypothetical protein